ncbi:pseudopilin, cryptic, general secretion pathway [Rubrivivax sp. A210]|uniref:type II secretion system major pseudopilin GspG n=1 Tax=Rubrivivax sp. A210 TaxID=2772301 RepID=UPI00191B4E7D|nr:type II secretion system major pseudopilin GspG [Rubrivivax sp. A210]CAD5371593.1 pseudopilin, cryptic, general secretion pathway [Rubrivivax sp. A210]
MSRGFTLFELLIVFAILSLLAGVVAPRFLERHSGAHAQAARAQIELLEKALDQYRMDARHYPSSEQGLAALHTAPAGATPWRGPYLKRALPADPWGRPYGYERPGSDGREYRVYSLGADGLPGGSGDNADLVSR